MTMVDLSQLVKSPASGKTLSLGGMEVIYKIIPEGTGGAFSVVEHPMEPKRLVRPHTHTREDEYSYVVEGEFGIMIGDEETLAGPGSWVVKPRGITHTFWNPGTAAARLIEIIAPGGFAHYFEELAPILTAGGPPDMAKLQVVHDKYGISYNMDLVPRLKEKYGLKLLGEP